MAYLMLASRGIGYFFALVPNRQTVTSAAPDWWRTALEIVGQSPDRDESYHVTLSLSHAAGVRDLSQCLALSPAAPQTQSCHLTESLTLVANVDLIDAGGSSSYDLRNSSLAKLELQPICFRHGPGSWGIQATTHRITAPYSRPTTK
ncbi:hypothetical protein GGI43DRAFT_382917 [Trichoderma evansii]